MTPELRELARKRAELENMLLFLEEREQDLRSRTGSLEEKLSRLQLEQDANGDGDELANELERSDQKPPILPSHGNGEAQSSMPLVVTEVSRGTERRIRLNRKTVFSWSYKELF